MPERTPLPRALAALTLLVVLTCLPSLSFAESDVSPAIVRIASTCDGKARRGTGFIVKLEEQVAHILTAAHTIAGCEAFEVEFAGRPHAVAGTTMDVDLDLALLRVDDPPPKLKRLLVTPQKIRPGSAGTIVGFPQGAIKPRYSTVTISEREGSKLSLTGLVDPGSSGSPLFLGQIVAGMVTQVSGIYPDALAGDILRSVAGGWLGELPLPEDLPGRRIKLIVSNHERDAVPGFKLRRDNIETKPTGETGFTELELSPRDDTGMAVQLEMPEDLKKEWVLATWQVNVPHIEEPEAVRVVAIRRSDFRDFPSEAFDQPTGQAKMTPEQQWQVIVDHAREKGLTEEELRQAVTSFADTKNQIDQGIAEMMQGAYSKAERHFEFSLQRAKTRIALRKNDAADAAMHLGLNRRLDNRFRESVSAYREAYARARTEPDERQEGKLRSCHVETAC